jgi:hypothetical protein
MGGGHISPPAESPSMLIQTAQDCAQGTPGGLHFKAILTTP